MNALDPYAAAALRLALKDAMADTSLRVQVLVLHGAGGHFCTGFDLKHKRVAGEEGALQDCFRILQDGPLPSIAAIEGNAFGAGVSLALACDQMVASRQTKICAPFTDIGLVPDVGMAITMERRVGPGNARRWMYEGSVVLADEALATGLIDACAEQGQALEVALGQAGRWAQRVPLAIAAVRRLSSLPQALMEQVFAEEHRLQAELAATEDFAEGVNAFRDRRKPVFQRR
ncbi:Enoyl-CoA hydratase/carnithine racemase [Polaromonas sp. OV174]|uniref:enoyl-CoA hydratase/isomerase family protein n=1 Tax=Polaromonas sp. OV174 TaxID=1855300 RepID=UPI0008ECD01C|nr:enoyl-CoA hydratase/isomerase family protein [Polaromonas sp. OV174]SFB89720.1 Enoyl-CoA hydratase/carnithine racemase [Polaromonas sp. OV174]